MNVALTIYMIMSKYQYELNIDIYFEDLPINFARRLMATATAGATTTALFGASATTSLLLLLLLLLHLLLLLLSLLLHLLKRLSKLLRLSLSPSCSLLHHSGRSGAAP